MNNIETICNEGEVDYALKVINIFENTQIEKEDLEAMCSVICEYCKDTVSKFCPEGKEIYEFKGSDNKLFRFVRKNEDFGTRYLIDMEDTKEGGAKTIVCTEEEGEMKLMLKHILSIFNFLYIDFNLKRDFKE